MSSRVHKGGQKFKPVAKRRGRPAEGSPNAPRVPLSFREATVESFRTQSERPDKPALEPARHSVAPLVTDSLSVQHDGSASTQKASSKVWTNIPVGSSNVDGHDRPSSIPVPSNIDSVFSGSISKTSAIEPVRDFNTRAVPIVSPSRSRQPQSAEPSTTPSVGHRTVLAHSQIPNEPQPTLHALLQDASQHADISRDADTASQQFPILLDQAIAPEAYQLSNELQPRPVQGDQILREISPQMKRRNRRRTESSDIEASTDRQDTGVENRMHRKRRASGKSKKSPDDVAASIDQQGTSDQTPRRSSQTRRSTILRLQTQELSDAISDGQANESDTEERRKRRRRFSTASSSATMMGRRSKNPVIFDLDADPGEELDPTVVTMATICDDTGQGRVSSKAAVIQRNHLAWKAANKQKRDRMRAVMEARKYGRKPDEDEGPTEGTQPAKDATSDEDETHAEGSSATAVAEDETGSGFNYKEALAVNRFTAQVRIGPNGETIIDEDSLFVDRTDHADDAVDTYQHIEESDQTKFTNSASYARKLRGSRWSAEETELFYDALSQFGENYELISYVLPGRDRKACKAKFKVEDRKNPGRITYCLNNRIPYDIQTLTRLTGKDFSGPTPEIKTPELQEPSEGPKEQPSEPEQHSEPDGHTRKQRKKSRTPAIPDDVEVVGDVETFEADKSDA